ncbi:hypothetical protein BD414DRAFT_538109 [Trametes punicea]|nr:hypothetical protein BD414DRAFT_538109 [Trametes punicea]
MPVGEVKELDEFHTNERRYARNLCLLREKYPSVEFYYIDIEEREAISDEVGIESLPTFVAFRRGVRIRETAGANSSALQSLIESVSKM